MIGHQLGKDAIRLLTRQQLRGTAQEHLYACMPAALVKEVALQQPLLLHHTLGDKPRAVANGRGRPPCLPAIKCVGYCSPLGG